MESSLPGLNPVREALDLSITTLAKGAGMCHRFLYRVAEGRQDCTTAKVRALVKFIGCGCMADDLLYVPTPQRLQKLAIAYKERELAALKASSEAVAS